MIISFDSGKIATTPNNAALLQQKKVNITKNGLDVVIPDAGYDGLSTVYVNATIDNGTGMKDFSVIGYDEELNIQMNQGIDADIAHSKELYDAWNPENTSADSLYKADKSLVYAPAIDTSNVTNFNDFLRESSVEYVPFYNLSKAMELNSFLNNCTFLKYVNVSGWDVSNAYNIGGFFAYTSNLVNIDGLDTWNPDKATNTSLMFKSCGVSSLNLGTWNLSAATICSYMFDGCINLESLDISGWNMANVSNTYDMFYNTPKLKEINFGYNIKAAFELQWSRLSVSSKESIINGLYDFTGNGETPTSSQGNMGVGSYPNMSDEHIEAITAKGWTLS